MKNKNKYEIALNNLCEYILTKGWVYLLLAGGLYLLYRYIGRGDFSMTTILGIFPLIAVGFILILTQSTKGFYVLFGVQFALVAGGMFFQIKMGVTTLIMTLFLSLLLIIYNIYKKVDWHRCNNLMLYLFIIWGMFCILELANPNNVMEAWNIAITHYLVYPLACILLVPIAIRSPKHIVWLLIIWSIFVLIATWKGWYQKTFGFNERELYFLYVMGGAKTHIIWSGIRYFSCFSDAANYGVHMAMAATTFGISAFFMKSKWLKIYFLLIMAAAIYSMGISGTRAAVVIPVAGIATFVLLSQSKKYALYGLAVFLCMLLFFRFTSIGDGNQYIRKMRTTFYPSQDASYLVRVENRKNMKELMKYKPIGYGQGLSKGERFYPKERMPYPPDSWLVAVWIENGIIGLLLYLIVHGVLFAWCGWTLLFKIAHKRLRGLLAAWLCMNAGFFVAAYVNDVMQYPNSIVVYTGFALCMAGPYIEQQMKKEEEEEKAKQPKVIEET